ncbi:MAG: TAXI family TRAP transporter solute-binding subunit [Planctomycetaceae bacterium]
MDKAITAFRRQSRKAASRIKTWGPVALLLILIVACAPLLIEPSCPKHIVIATGSPDGAYFAFANRYREIVARDGIELEVRSTAGSVENLRLLNSPDSDVSLAIVQGGVAPREDSQPIESLASLYLEPVWVFYRTERFRDAKLGEPKPVERLTQLAGKRIAVGAEGSGTQSIALQLLRENQLTIANDTTASLALGGREAVDALKKGELDAAFFVISPTSPLVHELLSTEGIELMSFRQAEAYRRRHPFLSNVTLAEGTVDLENNLPHRDVMLVAPTANLVCRKPLHSALAPLLLRAAFEVHEDGGVLENAGDFPSARFVDFPLNADARRYLKSGPPMFYRHLPFAAAAWLDRMKLMLFPLCTLLYPLLKAAPPIYRWRIRSKIYRWYRVLRDIDQKMRHATGNDDFTADIETLAILETELAEVSVPLSYMEEFYNLRQHVAFVRERLKAWDQSHAIGSRRVA